MSKGTVAGFCLLFLASASMRAGSAPAENGASVKLWVDTDPEDPCEKASPAGGDWMLQNNEGRNVHIVLRRATTQDGAITEDTMKDTIGPREVRAMGCESLPGGHQTMSVVRASF